MNIILFDVKRNKTNKEDVKTVKVNGFYFTVEYKNGSRKNYPFKDYDFFIAK